MRADFTAQWRNRRAVVITLIVPLIITFTWKPFVHDLGGAFVLSNGIVIGLIAVGLMGYSTSISRDRDKGIFQRLRVAPISTWAIMLSRLTVQLVMILLVATAVFIVGSSYDGVTLSPMGYILSYIAAIVGGAMYLSLGQMIVGRIKNPEMVNATVRLVYFAFIMVGMVGSFMREPMIQKIVKFSPYGSVRAILAAAMEPAKWNGDVSIAFLVTICYAVVFAFLGIKWFKWNTK